MCTVMCAMAEAQKGNRSLAAGLLVAIPQSDPYMAYESWNNSIGVEGIGQYNFTRKSSVVLQLQIIRFSGASYYSPSVYPTKFTSLALKGGYRYDFSPIDLYANFLLGVELNEMFTPATLGIGKRFHIHNKFIDAGVEYTGGYIPHYSIRAVYSLLQKANESNE